MNLLLCSQFSNLKLDEIFRDNFGARIKDIKVLYVPFAGVEQRWIDGHVDKLADYGIDRKKIEILAYDTPKENQYDAIFVAGGNNCLLKKGLVESGWWEEIYKRIKGGVFYIGTSAGGVICGKDFEFSTRYEDYIDGMNDYSGYGFVDKYIIVHYQPDNDDYDIRKKIVDELGNENCLILNNEEFVIIKRKN